MKIANISTIKNNLSQYLKYVQRGETVRILDRNVPVADLVPVRHGEKHTPGRANDRLLALEAKGVIHRGNGKFSADLLAAPARPDRDPKGRGVLNALLDERKEGR